MQHITLCHYSHKPRSLTEYAVWQCVILSPPIALEIGPKKQGRCLQLSSRLDDRFVCGSYRMLLDGLEAQFILYNTV